jgi:hypothetical protein
VLLPGQFEAVDAPGFSKEVQAVAHAATVGVENLSQQTQP